MNFCFIFGMKLFEKTFFPLWKSDKKRNVWASKANWNVCCLIYLELVSSKSSFNSCIKVELFMLVMMSLCTFRICDGWNMSSHWVAEKKFNTSIDWPLASMALDNCWSFWFICKDKKFVNFSYARNKDQNKYISLSKFNLNSKSTKLSTSLATVDKSWAPRNVATLCTYFDRALRTENSLPDGRSKGFWEGKYKGGNNIYIVRWRWIIN